MIVNPALIDTNVLVYAFDADSGNKQDTARDLLARCWKNEVKYSTSVQNLAEFSTVVREKVSIPVSGEEACAFIRGITEFQGWTVLPNSARTLMRAHEIRDEYGLHFWDALLAATMEEHGIRTIYTEDRHFTKIPWIKVIDPFA
jgi:predicted nucleic acid-binding protein